MEIILIVALGGLAIWWFFLRENASKPNTNFSSESGAPYKVEVPVQQPPVAESSPEPAKCGCGRSPTGFCVGLHKLTPEEWAVHADNPTKPAAVDNATPNPVTNPLDVNNDGKVNIEDVKEAVKKVKTRVKKAADVNGDGKVTKADAKAVVAKAKAKAPVKKKAKTSKK